MVDWLLKGTPRKVQIEALRRSYYGWKWWEQNPDLFECRTKVGEHLREDGPAKGWAHFLRMRLGKTPTALNEMELFRRDYGFKWHLQLTPNKYKLDWVLEAERFGISTQAFAFDSSKRDAAQRFIGRNAKEGGLLAVNYEALMYKDNLAVLEQICGPETYICADESINLKGHDTKYSVAAIELAKKCGARRVLSGKPVTQGPHDLWAQLRFIGELDGFVYHAFRNRFCKMGGFKGKQILGSKNEEDLHKLLDRCSWSPRREDWMITPGKDYAEHHIEMEPDQRRMYRQMQLEFVAEIADGRLVVADQIVGKLMKLQQISSGFIYDENRQPHDIIPIARNPKANAIKQLLASEIEGKVIVFAFYQRTLSILQEALKEFNPAIIRGQTSAANTVEQKNKFNSDPSCRVIIGQSTAIKYGSTLMGTPDDPCTTEIFAENDYSLDTRSQCEERAQGEGQQYPITIIDMVATSNDLAPIRALQRKEDVSTFIMRHARSAGVLPPAPEYKAS